MVKHAQIARYLKIDRSFELQKQFYANKEYTRDNYPIKVRDDDEKEKLVDKKNREQTLT
jgi:hypothetical protein